MIGKRKIDIQTKHGKTKRIHDVCYALGLKYNLFSAGQLLEKCYFLMFMERKCRFMIKAIVKGW